MSETAHTGAAPSRAHRTVRRVIAALVTVLAVTASLVSSLGFFGAEGTVPGQDELEPSWYAGLSLFVAMGVAVTLVWRHQYPVIVTGITIVPPLFLLADSLAALIALAALAASRRDRVLWAGTILVFVATAVALERDAGRHPEASLLKAGVDPENPAGDVNIPLPVTIFIAVVATAIPLGVGLWRSTRRDLSRRDIKEQGLQAEVARQEERSRIAREMHDVLGHRLSILSLHAGALEVNIPDGNPGAADAARSVRTTAKDALADLRHVIGVLKDGQRLDSDDEGPQPDRPQPTLADIPDVIASSREAGQPVNITILLDDSSAAPAALGTSAYRIIQESLTNALRHAPGVTAEVTVRGGPGVGLTIEVINAIPDTGSTETAAGSGVGLAGIDERVAQLGGTISTGPTDENTFAVNAWLPWPRSS